MITEFTCGIYTAKLGGAATYWDLFIFPHNVGVIYKDGHSITFNAKIVLPLDDLIEIAVLMNNIKRQYKQLQTN